MTRDNVILGAYADEEWARILDPDPRTADEEPWTAATDGVSWQIAAAASDHGGAPAMLGLVMLSLAFAAGVVVGWAVWHG